MCDVGRRSEKLTALEELDEDVGVPLDPLVLNGRHLGHCMIPIHANLETEWLVAVKPAKSARHTFASWSSQRSYTALMASSSRSGKSLKKTCIWPAAYDLRRGWLELVSAMSSWKASLRCTSTGSGQGMDGTCTRLTARPAANGLAARSTITLTYFSRSCMLEDAMLVCLEGCPEYPWSPTETVGKLHKPSRKDQ